MLRKGIDLSNPACRVAEIVVGPVTTHNLMEGGRINLRRPFSRCRGLQINIYLFLNKSRFLF